ncbi:MerR family transcriptional regulator [Prauserella marina]|uniref:MerR HTH family regulatory protein n=1 Tax=Prauserella marina TaxID=530584 RepID=A0A222VJQ9_9PSEU|nr:MerR family transcriptional regulator [Prauserella marina]PWV82794.1 MerR-like DNA binding protein [Prauserella marina]SDC77434.1 MerR HTH family regulatory protein [Prauserella marina]
MAPSTLRTWDRRYGLGPSRHTGGRHRRYGAADVVRLEMMQRALLRGASTAEAARFALDQVPKSDGVLTAESEPASGVAGNGAGTPPARIVPVAESEGTPGPPRFARRLSAAALAMDVRAMQHLLTEVIGTLGVLDAWEGVIKPVVGALDGGRREGTNGSEGSEVGYLLNECVFAALVRATPMIEQPRNLRPVLIGCVPEEMDALPVYVLGAALAERRLATQLFGRPIPADVLAAAVRRSAPAAVVLWADRSPAVGPRLFTRLARGRQRGRLFASGPGWREPDLPPKVELVGGVREAAERVEYVLLGGGKAE